MNAVYTMKGIGELLEVYEDKVAITPKGAMGFLSKGLKGTKTIPFFSITAIQFKKSGLISGYLQFTVPGGIESRGGAFAAALDENTFMFKGQNELALEIKNYIENYSEKPTINANSSLSAADEIKKLKQLLDEGILTEDEFSKKKQQLLGL